MMSNSLRLPKLGLAILLISSLLTGCWERRTGLSFLGEESNHYYKDIATNIEFPDETQETPEEVVASAKPRTINDRSNDDVWELPLSEAIVTAIQNNRVIRSDASFLSPGNSIFTNPDRVASVYDPSIQESGVLFGGRGIEAALAAFDARWDTRLLWGRNSNYLNSLASPGAAATAETANFDTSLTKSFGYGGQVALGHNVNYLGSNAPGQLYPSTYTGSLAAEYRQPLLAGAGADYTRIAGPITQSFGGITGVNQGVVIARINNDITVADLENNVRNLVLDVEQLYWELYLAYVQYDTAVKTRESARTTWSDQYLRRKGANNELDDEGAQRLPDEIPIGEAELQLTQFNQNNASQGERPDYIGGEYQARDAYYASRVAVEQTLSSIYSTENRLRRLLGLQVNDGRIIRPSDEPMTAEFIPDWYDAIADGLTNRVELRRQKWNVKSLELQLTAAKSLTRPRLDFVTSARVNGLGDDLIGTDRGDGITGEGLDNLYGSLASGGTSGWTAGVEMSIPVGFRSALAQVQNIELRLSKAREVLSVQEMEISHEIAASMQELALAHQNMKTLYNRRIAAQEFEDHEKKKRIILQGSPDLLLRAIRSRAEADLDYYQSLIQYNQALARFQFRKGTLLEYNNVYLAEDHWDPEAYNDALRRAQERGHAIENNLIDAKLAPFSMGPINPQQVELRQPIDESGLPMPLPQEELPPTPGEPVLVPPAVEIPARPYDDSSVSTVAPSRKTLALRPVPDSRALSRLVTRTLTHKVPSQPQPRPAPRPPATLQTVNHESVGTESGIRHPVVSTPAVKQMNQAFEIELVTIRKASAVNNPVPRTPFPRSSQPSRTNTATDKDSGDWYPLD